MSPSFVGSVISAPMGLVSLCAPGPEGCRLEAFAPRRGPCVRGNPRTGLFLSPRDPAGMLRPPGRGVTGDCVACPDPRAQPVCPFASRRQPPSRRVRGLHANLSDGRGPRRWAADGVSRLRCGLLVVARGPPWCPGLSSLALGASSWFRILRGADPVGPTVAFPSFFSISLPFLLAFEIHLC